MALQLEEVLKLLVVAAIDTRVLRQDERFPLVTCGSVPGTSWDQLPQNRIPPNVLIYHVQPRVPLTLHTLSPGFQKSSEFYWPDSVQIDFPAYYFFYLHTYLLERFTAEPEERGEAERNTWNPGISVSPYTRSQQLLNLKSQDFI